MSYPKLYDEQMRECREMYSEFVRNFGSQNQQPFFSATETFWQSLERVQCRTSRNKRGPGQQSAGKPRAHFEAPKTDLAINSRPSGPTLRVISPVPLPPSLTVPLLKRPGTLLPMTVTDLQNYLAEVSDSDDSAEVDPITGNVRKRRFMRPQKLCQLLTKKGVGDPRKNIGPSKSARYHITWQDAHERVKFGRPPQETQRGGHFEIPRRSSYPAHSAASPFESPHRSPVTPLSPIGKSWGLPPRTPHSAPNTERVDYMEPLGSPHTYPTQQSQKTQRSANSSPQQQVAPRVKEKIENWFTESQNSMDPPPL